MRATIRPLALAGLALLLPAPALAVEGGLSAYLLGSRDAMAGFVPPPGTYATTDFIFLDGSVSNVSIGGIPVKGADVSLSLLKLGFTQSFDTQIWGGAPAINLNIPFASADLTFTGPFGKGLTDSEQGIGDIAVTPMLGWHRERLHWNAFASVYVPVGLYDKATISVDPATKRITNIDALSIGKNVWGVQPGLAATWLDPKTGVEISGAASVLFTSYNDATDYQSAPQYTVELAVLQHLPSGWAFGLTGYIYGQTDDDSGDGAEAIKKALGAESLQAQVFGAGPLLTYQGKFLGRQASFKVEYTGEFGAKRRFESNILWLSATLAF